MGDWQEWAGGSMPVAADVYVGIVFRNGNTVVADLAGGFEWGHAPDFDRDDPRHPGWWDIVRYRAWPA